MALAFGLAFIEALGLAKAIDPGKPGVTDFGRQLFDSDILQDISASDEVVKFGGSATAALRADTEPAAAELAASRADFISRIEAETFGGVVLDYDGHGCFD